MFGTVLFGVGRSDRYANLASSGVAAGMTQYASCRYFRGDAFFPSISIATVCKSSHPGLSPKRLHTFRSQVRCCEPGLRHFPTILRFPALPFRLDDWRAALCARRYSLARHLEGDWRIGHTYSSTEAGAIAVQVFTPSRLPDAGIVAAGRPVDGVEVFIKDETGALVAPGEIGEIVVRSRFLAQGYWNNPELTAKVFQTDPFDSAIRIYRTGDLGRLRNDGTLELMGRKGRRIRLRGYNIEPFQVECELMRQPGVTDAVVLLHDGAAGQEPCLVGYVVAPRDCIAIRHPQGARRAPAFLHGAISHRCFRSVSDCEQREN